MVDKDGDTVSITASKAKKVGRDRAKNCYGYGGGDFH